MSDNLQLQILQYSYWEHFKAAKDLSLILPITNHRRIAIEKTIDELQKQIIELS